MALLENNVDIDLSRVGVPEKVTNELCSMETNKCWSQFVIKISDSNCVVSTKQQQSLSSILERGLLGSEIVYIGDCTYGKDAANYIALLLVHYYNQSNPILRRARWLRITSDFNPLPSFLDECSLLVVDGIWTDSSVQVVHKFREIVDTLTCPILVICKEGNPSVLWQELRTRYDFALQINDGGKDVFADKFKEI